MCVDEDMVVAVDVIPGQPADAPRLAPLLSATLAAVGPVDEVGADTGFDGDGQWAACLEAGVLPVIPDRRDRVDPWPFDPTPYRQGNRVERLFGKAERFRAMATRDDKLRVTYDGVLCLVFGFLRLRKIASSVNTTYDALLCLVFGFLRLRRIVGGVNTT